MALKSKPVERGFTYQKRTKDDLKERANMKGGNFDSIFLPKFKQWTPKDGKNRIRILPATWHKDDAPWQRTAHYGLDVFINYSIGADNQRYLSLHKHGKGADPLEEARREAQREGDKDLAKALNANHRILYWIIDRNDEDEGPLLWAAPFTFDTSLANLCIDEDTKDVMFIDDPATGRDVRFYKEGSGLLTKYDPSKMKVLPESPIAEDEDQENDWLDFINENPLPSVLNFYDYDHIKATFDGVAGKRDEDEENEKPAGKPNGRQHVAHRASDPEDDAPAKPARRTRPTVDEDDPSPRRGPRRDQDPDDADDENEAPPPRRQRAVVEDDDPPSTRRTSRSNEEEGGGSLREKLAARRRRATTDEDD
jgi:hypothetical protein